MDVKIKNVTISNFKGVRNLSVTFSRKTKIKGANGTGKTSIMDAVMWCLFGVDSGWNSKFNIRPLDSSGKMIHDIEISVETVLTVDEKEIVFKRVSNENWVTKRGSQNKTLQGNVGSYFVDDYPRTEQEYKSMVSEIVNENLFKMLTSPTYFSSRPWKEQREILMKFVSDISDVELAQSNPEFADLIPELEKAPSTDDIQKKFSKALSEWKKKQAEIPVRIDELSKSLVDIDFSAQELAKVDLEHRISELDEKIADSGKAVSDLMSEEMQLQFDINGMYTEANDKLIHERREFEDAIYEAQRAFNDAHNAVSDAQKQIDVNTRQIELEEQRKPEINKRWTENLSQTFDETPYQFDESKWVFDENSTICSLCGQKFPEDKIASLKEEFEQKKATAKADAEKKLADAREKFNSDRQAVKDSLNLEANAIKQTIQELTDKNASLQKEIEVAQKAETDAMAKKNQLEKQLSELPEKPDMSQNEEYQQKKERYDELEKQIASLKDSTSVSDSFNEERKALVAELDSVKDEIAKASKNIEIEERICELEEEQKEVGQRVADMEKMLFLLEQFIRSKMLRISDSINQHFKTVNFKLFETLLNGGVKECCECTVGGIPFSSLNSGHRIVAGLDIISSLSELYDAYCPIFTDNSESINEFNVPDMKSQMVFLMVSEDKELIVSNE